MFFKSFLKNIFLFIESLDLICIDTKILFKNFHFSLISFFYKNRGLFFFGLAIELLLKSLISKYNFDLSKLTLSWHSHKVQDQNLLREGLYAIENIRNTIKGASSW